MPEHNVGDETLIHDLRTTRTDGDASDYHGGCGLPIAEDLEKLRMNESLTKNQPQGKPYDVPVADEQQAAVPVDLNSSGALQRDSLDVALAAAEPVRFRLSGTLTFSQTRWRSMDVSPVALEQATFPLESDACAKDSLDVAMSAAKPSKFSPCNSLTPSQKEWKSLDSSTVEVQSSPWPTDDGASTNLAMTQEHGMPKQLLRLNNNTAAVSNSNQSVPKRTNFMTQMSQFARAPKFTFAGRHAKGGFLSSNSTAPGPGAYNASVTTMNKHKSEPAFRFGASNRPGPVPEKNNPGPGAYNPRPNLVTEPKALFGTSLRAGERKGVTQGGPGPGAYDVRNPQRGPMFTAAGRRNQAPSVARSRSMPGPGAYSPPVVRTTVVKACSFGTSARGDVHGADKKKHIPGPGAYTSQIGRRFGSEAPGATLISRRGNVDPNGRTPGPGEYNTQMTSFGY